MNEIQQSESYKRLCNVIGTETIMLHDLLSWYSTIEYKKHYIDFGLNNKSIGFSIDRGKKIDTYSWDLLYLSLANQNQELCDFLASLIPE